MWKTVNQPPGFLDIVAKPPTMAESFGPVRPIINNSDWVISEEYGIFFPYLHNPYGHCNEFSYKEFIFENTNVSEIYTPFWVFLQDHHHSLQGVIFILAFTCLNMVNNYVQK